MNSFFRRIKLSSAYIVRAATKWTATVYAVAGFVGLFGSFDDIFSKGDCFWYKLLFSIAILVAVWLSCAIINAVVVGFQRKKKVVEGQNGKSVYVVYGDILDPHIVNSDKRYVAFAVNRCFDTVVDDKLIAARTVHGVAFNWLYSQKIYTPDSLNDTIQKSIKGNPSFEILNREDKPEGNLKRYEVGTYANLPIDNKLNYLLLGLTNFDSNLNAYATKQDFVLSIQKFIEAFDKEAQCYPVLMPIIGAGRSRIDLNERDALEFIIEAFKINQLRITSDIYIVVFESSKNRVSISDL